MKNSHIIVAGISGFTAVALGAFGAHGLKSTLTEEMFEIFRTGVLYHSVHSVMLLALSLSDKKLILPFWFIFSGIILFSFSLYVYSLTTVKMFALITPIGGISLLIGWSVLIYKAIRKSY